MPQSLPNLNLRPLYQDASLEDMVRYLLELDAFLQEYIPGVFGDAQSSEETLAETQATLDGHAAATTGVHGIEDTSALETQAGAQAKAGAAEAAAKAHADQQIAGLGPGDVGAYPAGSKVADSDKLDGQDGSYYTNITARLGYTPVNKAGDSMTGNLGLPDEGLAVGRNRFGALATDGVLDWNDVSNTRPGTGVTLLMGNALNGPGPAQYFHAFNIEYQSKTGAGNVTQFAIPYGNSVSPGIFVRGRYSGTWTAWVKLWTSGNDGLDSGLDADLLDGLQPSTGATANSIAQRDGNGDLTARVVKPTQYLQLPVLAADPASPPNGAMWMRA